MTSYPQRRSVMWSMLVLALVTSTACVGQVCAAEARALPFLMAEDFEDLDFCAWRVESGRPDPHNPLVEPAMPWDAGGVLAHGTVLHDPIDGLWKAWQHSIPIPGKPEKQDARWWNPHLTYLE